MSEIKRALLSVSDKSGIVDLAKELEKNNIEIISTGGTAQKLREDGINVTSVSKVTDFPEMMEGRVKTLHPNIHAGLLARRSKKADMKELKELDIKTIDLVVCNFYPFAETIKKENVEMKEVLENIDIGGPTMIRAAAKNFPDVLVVVDSNDYKLVKQKISDEKPIDYNFKKKMAYKAFNHTAEYDAVIQEYLFNDIEEKNKLPSVYIKPYYKSTDLRYGENPHQSAAFYKEAEAEENSITNAVKLKGKKMSFNNINDTNGALELLKEYTNKPTAAVIKHTNPCGLASGEDIITAFKNAYAGDPLSAFGSVVSLNRKVDESLAKEIVSGEKFIEVITAPDFSNKAVEILNERWNSLRILKTGELNYNYNQLGYDLKKVTGGLLIQDRDLKLVNKEDIELVTDNKGEEQYINDLMFAWKAVKHVKSNAIVMAKDEMLVGVGAGQMSRVDSMIIAGRKAKGRQKGAVVASDAFFPFPDAIEKASDLGIKAIIQPGGSIRDETVIKKANQLGIAMYLTKTRHFRH
ncbi:MAG: bifunctional phosphoribosylaminoimidazolecarboxamide formyltransferase/IMP cyclohydrolase [Halanaerobiales bacterium]|nr:bifunctional phosphoribosylaminoimidazolecarboxamide formyltransferase/IMP cyclohydrolase [Halanaerobiales bacterium]